MATSSRPAWRTSSFTDNGGTCVEVAPEPGAVRVRDTKNRGRGPEIVLEADAFAALCAAAAAHPTRHDPMISHAERRTRHDGRTVRTQWHVAVDGTTLHFTDAEWHAFACGVRAGEFAFILVAP